MIVLVETNFLLHIALQQEQAGAAESLLGRADSGEIQLCIPAVCLSEATSRVTYGRLERRRESERLNTLVKQLGQSTPHVAVSAALREVAKSVVETGTADVAAVWGVLDRCMKIALALPLDAAAWSHTQSARSQFNMEIGDAMVLGSIVSFLESARPAESVFVSTDFEAFDAQDVKERLSALGCRYLKQFAYVGTFLDSRRSSSG